MIGFEALLRWHHQRRGLQPPDSIQAAFDDSLLASELTDRMIDRVLADVGEFNVKGVAFGRIAINGSLADFRRDGSRTAFSESFSGWKKKKKKDSRRRCSSPKSPKASSSIIWRSTSSVRCGRWWPKGVSIALDDLRHRLCLLTAPPAISCPRAQDRPIASAFLSRLDSTDSADFAIVHGVIDSASRMNCSNPGCRGRRELKISSSGYAASAATSR